MPYIPQKSRQVIDVQVSQLADEMVAEVVRTKATVEISELYRRAFDAIAVYLASHAQTRTTVFGLGGVPGATTGPALSTAEKVAQSVLEASRGCGQKGGWLRELSYAITSLIQTVPHRLSAKSVWDETLSYGLYVETIGALTRTVHDILTRHGSNWISNGIAGVFEDVKDEFRRRIGNAFKCSEIAKHGDCFQLAPCHTVLVETELNGVKGWVEIMVSRKESVPSQHSEPKT